MYNKLQWLLFCLCAAALATENVVATENDAAPTSKSFPITTLLNAKWEQTPLHMEIAEYLADENANLYWDFVKAITTLDTALNDYDTESKQYNMAIDVVRSLQSNVQLPLLKLVVSMHSLTPRIQAHFQIAADVLRLGDCKARVFAQLGQELACSLEELQQKLSLDTAAAATTLDAAVESYAFDHIYPGSENVTRTVVVYADIGSPEFATYHKLLEPQALAGQLRYIVRHFQASNSAQTQRKVRLSGYGVELHLKSTEYKSQDDATRPANEEQDADAAAADALVDAEVQGFDFKLLKSKYPALSQSLEQLRSSLLQKSEEIAQLKAWQFQDLGLQAASSIAALENGEQALQLLQFLSQNFPMQAKSLLQQRVSSELRAEVAHNTELFARSLNLSPPDGALFVNGLFYDADSIELSALVETLRAEQRVLERLHANNIRGGKLAASLLALDFSAGAKDFAIDIRDSAIMWINDIESDAQYRRWPSSVMDLLRPSFPGMLRNIRKNVFNLVLLVDPLQPRERSLLKLAESFVLHQAPVRLGLVFDARQATTAELEEDYVAMFCAFNYVTQQRDARAALSFLTDIFADVGETQPISRKQIRAQLKKSFERLSNEQLDDLISEDSDLDYGRQLSAEFVARLGFAASPQALLNGVPMQQQLLSSDSDFEEAIFSEILQQTTALQKSVYRGELTDSDVFIDYLMNQPHVMPRLNQRILGAEQHKYLDLSGVPHADLSNVRSLAKLSLSDMTATLLHNIKYFGGKSSGEKLSAAAEPVHFLTVWIVADLEQDAGRNLLYNALQHLRESGGSSMRIAFIPNAEGAAVSRDNNLNRLVWAATQTMTPQGACALAFKWLQPDAKSPVMQELPAELLELLPATELQLRMLRVYSQRTLGLGASQRLVVGNGRIYGPLQAAEQFSSDDFALIERYNAQQYAEKLRPLLQTNSKDAGDEADLKLDSDLLFKLYASLVPRESKTRFKIPQEARQQHSVLQLKPQQSELPAFDIVAVLDPASRAAQKLAPLLQLLRQTTNCAVRVFLTPLAQHSDMPVKSFYRYVVAPEVQFVPSGRLADGPQAKFSGLPANTLLTQHIQAPENWLVEVVRAVYDLDNIKLSDIGGPVHSECELEYLLLEGHCFDASSGAPPRGLQVTLGTPQQPTLVDTIVMANLGYFQLKANPGIWQLRLREGKSSEIYEISSAEGPNTLQSSPGDIRLVLSSLRSHVVKLRVAKRPGMQSADLLGDETDDKQNSGGIWNSITSSFGGGSGAAETEVAEVINIFSVASGHLYERLLRIMMLSLLKHTKSPVKFWFLKNYLSPQFSEVLPHMARAYGFQYELVQYKWPRWLHQQTEKQRTIWGYKILFLDVLFPLNVRKIIFVDADAIVRADIKQLYDMDLGGAPYAYTPFCDSRQEMEGFRFWKQGYWRSHLMGRRYHISALYVVDLRRFRKIAAGDRLRGQYQALSQDPNSLANLDQDLPNNMIHQVAIKSLPDDWLWCQTWCSDSALKRAKVIDLCNNPLTKEAKLTAAQRIVPEWKDYDAEIKKLLSQIEDHENADHETLLVSGSEELQAAPEETAKQAHAADHSEL